MSEGRSIKHWAKNVAIALALVGLVVALTGEPGRAVVTAGLVDPMSVLAGRSPGERAPGAVAHAKPRLASHPTPATERVLTAVRTRPVSEPEPTPPGDVAWLPVDRDIFPDEEPDLVSSGVVGELIDAVFQPDVTVPFQPTVFVPITGGGVLPPRPAVVPPLPVSGIPEPTTWLMMIVGFLAIGRGLRKHRATLPSKRRPRPA